MKKHQPEPTRELETLRGPPLRIRRRRRGAIGFTIIAAVGFIIYLVFSNMLPQGTGVYLSLCFGLAFTARTRLFDGNNARSDLVSKHHGNVCPFCEYSGDPLADTWTCPECGRKYERAVLDYLWRSWNYRTW